MLNLLHLLLGPIASKKLDSPPKEMNASVEGQQSDKGPLQDLRGVKGSHSLNTQCLFPFLKFILQT